MTDISIPNIISWFEAHPWVLLLVTIWVMFWKGLALWRSAGLRQKWWFIALLLVNTFGILEIIYIYFIAKKYKVEVVETST